MEIRPELYDKLKELRIEAYKYTGGNSGSIITFRGPTWCVNPKTPLETYTDEFIRDEHGAMKDYAALPGLAIDSFFSDPAVLDRNAIPRDKSLVNETTLEIDPYFKPVLGFNYFVGIDLSTGGGDATGIALVYYNWVETKISMPVNFRMMAPKGEAIDYSRIMQFIYELRDRGFNIKKVAFDQYQSHGPILELNSNGIEAQKLNYSETLPGCKQLQELILTEKFEYYSDQTEFIGEAQHLIIKNSKRIDHPSSGPWANRKDCWDAAVNASICAMEDYYKNGSLAQENQAASNIVDHLLDKQRQETVDLGDLSWIL